MWIGNTIRALRLGRTMVRKARQRARSFIQAWGRASAGVASATECTRSSEATASAWRQAGDPDLTTRSDSQKLWSLTSPKETLMYREAPIVSDSVHLVVSDLNEDTKMIWPEFGGNVIVTDHTVEWLGAERGRVQLGPSLKDQLLSSFRLAVICDNEGRDPACVWVQQRIEA